MYLSSADKRIPLQSRILNKKHRHPLHASATLRENLILEPHFSFWTKWTVRSIFLNHEAGPHKRPYNNFDIECILYKTPCAFTLISNNISFVKQDERE